MKVPVVLAVISVTISTASGAATTAPPSASAVLAIVTPTSTFPETDTSWNSAEIHAVYFDMNTIDGSLLNFSQMLIHKNEPDDRSAKIIKWSKNLGLGSGAYDGAQWMKYYMLIDALKNKYQFDFAVKIIDELHVPGTPITSVSAEIRKLMRGGPNFRYRGILTSLFEAEYLRNSYNGPFLDILQSRLTTLAYGLDYNDYAASSLTELTLPSVLTIERNIVKYYVGLMKSTKEQIKSSIPIILAYDNVELANVALIKVTTGQDNAAVTRELAKDGIWGHVKSEAMARLLRNKFKVPIFRNALETARSDVYALTDENQRYQVLRMLKNTQATDVASHKAQFERDPNMTIREALLAGKANLVKSFFTKPEFTVYDSKWILHAIKFSTRACLKILLEERVPLPTAAELTAAYALQKEQGAKLLVESYTAKYAAFAIALALPPVEPTTLHDPAITAAETDLGVETDLYPEVTRIGVHESTLFETLEAIALAVPQSDTPSA